MQWTELQRRSDDVTDSCSRQAPLARGPQLRADEESQNERPTARCPQPVEVTKSTVRRSYCTKLRVGAVCGLSCSGCDAAPLEEIIQRPMQRSQTARRESGVQMLWPFMNDSSHCLHLPKQLIKK